MGLLSFNEWQEWAIDLLCSNERCKSEITIDSRSVTNLIYCSKKCAKLDGLTERVDYQTQEWENCYCTCPSAIEGKSDCECGGLCHGE